MSPKRGRLGVKNLTFEPASGLYRYRNTLNGTRTYVGRDRERAIEFAHRANAAIELQRKELKRRASGVITVAYVIDRFIELAVPGKPWKDSTRKNNLAKLRLYRREFGDRLFEVIDRVFLAEWIDARCHTHDCRHKHRTLLGDIWAFAISRRWAHENEPLAVYRTSGSRKVEANRKVRKRLDIEGFRAIHAAAPEWLGNAMELSLATLQGRSECVRAEYAHFRDGSWYVIREKTSADSDMAFIRIELTATIEAILARSRRSGIASPFVIHARPKSMRPQHQMNKPHWTAITGDYLTKTFQKVRDGTGAFAHLAPRERPTFHEIRSLGARTYRELGYPKEYIQQLMTHADERATEIYLANPDALGEQHYRPVKAEMDLERVTAGAGAGTGVVTPLPER